VAQQATGRSAALERRFEAIVFDWDGTAVPDRSADASRLRSLVEELCAAGMDVAVVSGTTVENVDRQLIARPGGPGSLHMLMNRGSEVFRVGKQGPELVCRRGATRDEEAALDRAAELAVQGLGRSEVEVVSRRLNRRKIDLIPLAEWADPPKARIAELVEAVEGRLREGGIDGLRQAIELAERAAGQAGLSAARVSSDAKHVEIGLTDKSDSARWMLEDLWGRGIGPGLVLIAGDEFGPLGGSPGSDANLMVPEAARATAVSVGVEPGGVPPAVVRLGGGPERFHELLADQLARRRRGDPPELDGDPGWTLRVEGIDPELERAHESLLTLADGRIGTRGTPLGQHVDAAPLVVAAGVYRNSGAETELRPGPQWNQLPFDLDSKQLIRRELDLHTGLMRQEAETPHGPVRAVLFSSLARPRTVGLRCFGPSAAIAGGEVLRAPSATEEARLERGVEGESHWMSAGDRSGALAAAAVESVTEEGPSAHLDRLAVYRAGSDRADARLRALSELGAKGEAGFEKLLTEHRAAWARRWSGASVEIEGEPALQHAVRLALFHLMASAADTGEPAVGARGLTGKAYRGHVFWDTDVFVLPFFAATHPEAARAILEYRVRRLPSAIDAARRAGRAGARFPWESATAGDDVTPTSAVDRAGRPVAIQTGRLEEHIVAGVAWAVACYVDWTGDEDFLESSGAELLIETARYWASRIELDAGGRGHIRGVIGPDEYHVEVDDNAYTNVMARWNLRRAASLDPRYAAGVGGEERRGWLASAASLVDGFDPASRLYEQFEGFSALEPLIIADLAPRRPISADLLLGPERVGSSQVIKQADVLMLHHLVPEEVAPDSLDANLRFYEPRTAHASSLSPGVHAALLARAGLLDDALDSLRLTARIDLDDLSEATAGGVHLGAMGTVWQTLAWGFAGVRAEGGALRVDPRLPEQWNALRLGLRFHGAHLRLEVEAGEARLTTDQPIRLKVGTGTEPMTIAEGTASWDLHGPRVETAP
jgi:trehalose/maltose hydrolase-like predicted phosphorylase